MRGLVSVVLPFAAGMAFAVPDFLIFSLFINRAVSTSREVVGLGLFVQNTSPQTLIINKRRGTQSRIYDRDY